MMIGFSWVMGSMLYEFGKASHDGMWRFLYIVFGIFSLGAIFLSHLDPGASSLGVTVFCGLLLGRRLSERSARSHTARRMNEVRHISEWGSANFTRLDVGGDGVVCAYDLYRFAGAVVSAEDQQQARNLAAALADISRSVNGSAAQAATTGQPLMAAPVVVSREDLLAYPAKKASIWAGWLK
jgi:hypothetical protein